MKIILIAVLLAASSTFGAQLTVNTTDTLPQLRTKLNSNFGELYAADTTFALAATTLTIAGTANEITSNAGAQTLGTNRIWSLSLPSALTFTGKTVTGGTYAGPVLSGTVTGTYTLGGTATFPSAVTLDTEWNTIAKIETATGVNIIVATEIDTPAELEALIGGSNVILDSELNTMAKMNALILDGDIQPLSANLTIYSGIAPSANIQSLLGAVDYNDVKTQLSLTVGTNVQAYNANLTTFAAIAPSANVIALLNALDYAAFKSQLSLGLNAAGFDGNLTTADDTLQEIAQKLDDLVNVIPDNSVTGAKIAMGSDSAGDVLYYNGTDYVRLAKGADGTVLKLTSGIPAWLTDNTAGSPTFDTLGDAAGDGTLAFGATEQDITSTIDAAGKTTLTITNTDADAANDNSILDLAHNDGADANVFYLRMIGDADGTPTLDYLFSQSGFTSLLPVNVPAEAYDSTGWNGDTGAPQKDAVRDQMELKANLAGGNTFTGTQVFPSGQALIAPALGTPVSVVLTNATGTAASLTAGTASAVAVGGITGLGTGVATALAVNVGTAGAPVINGGALGSPSSAGTIPAFTLGGTVAGGGNQINNVIIGSSTPLAGTFTTVTAGSTNSLALGTAGSAVGNILVRNATSGTISINPPTGALGVYQVTWPNAASTLPIYGQQVTYAGPTAARTVTYPDANFTVARTDAANTFTGVQTLSSAPVLSTGTVTVSGNTVTVPAAADTLVGKATTDTLTNKRITARVTSISSSATPTVNSDNCDVVTITALAAAITSMTTNLSGTPSNFDQLEFRILDNGTARAITWGASFASGTATLPTTTTLGKALCVYLEYDSVQLKWMCMSTGSYP